MRGMLALAVAAAVITSINLLVFGSEPGVSRFGLTLVAAMWWANVVMGLLYRYRQKRQRLL